MINEIEQTTIARAHQEIKKNSLGVGCSSVVEAYLTHTVTIFSPQ